MCCCEQADSYISGYCSLTDTPLSAATTAVATATPDSTPLSVAVAAAVHYSYILNTTPNCSAITLSQTEFYGNKAVGGGGGAIFWDGPVEDLVVSCSDMEDAFGARQHACLYCEVKLQCHTKLHFDVMPHDDVKLH